MSCIVTVTLNPAIDRLLSISHVTPDAKLRCTSDRRDPGGGGVNVTRTIHELGGESLAIFTCGGYTGQMYRELLDREGVQGRAIPIEGLTREHIMVNERATGRMFRFGEAGPTLSAEEAQACLDAVAELDPATEYLVLSGSLPGGLGDDFYARVIRRAPAGARVVVDTTASALGPALDEGVHLIKPNARELGELVGGTIEGRREIVAASRALIEGGKAEVVVTSLAAGGAILVAEELAMHLHAPAVKVESKVGAGDSMVAGMVLALDRGWSLPDSVRFGIAAGAAAVMDPETGLGSRATVERLHEQMVADSS